MNFPAGEVDGDKGQFKRPKRSSQYSNCCKAGLWEVASKYGYISEQLGLQLALEKMVSLLHFSAVVLFSEQQNNKLSFFDVRVMN